MVQGVLHIFELSRQVSFGLWKKEKKEDNSNFEKRFNSTIILATHIQL